MFNYITDLAYGADLEWFIVMLSK